MAREIIYVAFGYEYLLMAAYSASSAKAHNRDIVCSVVTNVQTGNNDAFLQYFDNMYELEMESDQNREIKTTVIKYATAETCVFLDCDTEVRGDLSPMFRCLEKYDIIVKLMLHPTIKDYEIAAGLSGSEFPYWNSGVIFFRNNERAISLFATWNSIFREMGKRSDQPALARAVYENPEVRLLSVGYIWNTFKSDISMLQKSGGLAKTKILHYRDAVDFPEIAQKILEIDAAVCAAMHTDTPFLAVARQEVFRYRIIASRWYRSRFARPIFLQILKWGARWGMSPRFSPTRFRAKKGDRFDRLTV